MRITALAAAIVLAAAPARADDAIEAILHSGRVPAAILDRQGYSDFTEPLGRFLDLLAAGGFTEARRIQPAACARWQQTRDSSAFSGKFRVWGTDLDLDTLCAVRQGG